MRIKVLTLIAIGLGIRLLLIPTAFHGDLNNNYSWGKELVERGAVGLYERSEWSYSVPNQPPLYIITFGGSWLFFEKTGALITTLNKSLSVFPSSLVWFWENLGLSISMKLPGIIADIAIAIVIYKFFMHRKENDNALALTAAWLLAPVAWYSSAVWGQVDTLVNLFGLLSILALIQKRLPTALMWYTVSILFKGSLLLFAPFLLLYAIQSKYSLSSWLRAIGLSALVIFSISFPFHPQADVFLWLGKLYGVQILPGEIGFLTANAFNFWWLVDSGKTLDAELFFGIPARIWGLGMFLTVAGWAMYQMFRKLTTASFLLLLIIVQLAGFMLLTRMHERYLFPVFPLGMILVGLTPSFWPYLGALVFLHLANLYSMFWAPGMPWLENMYNFPILGFIIALAQIGILALLIRRVRIKYEK